MPEAHLGASGLKYLIAALCVVPACMRAQTIAGPAGNSITISIVSEAGTPLAFSTVSISETGVERFSNQRGEYFVSGLPAGSYHVRVKQLGFVAKDTTVRLSGTHENLAMQVRLTPIPFLLDKVVVTAVGKCPVATDLEAPDNASLALIFGEVSKNAERLRLLQDRYPFTYTLWREFMTYDRYLGPRNIQRDTVTYASTASWRYAPGEVVQQDSMTAAGQQVMRLPQLVDLADTAFQSTHCFYYRGTEKRDDGLQHRVDFIPLSEFDFPDVEGSVFIDTHSFVLTSAVFRLTNGEKLKPPVSELEVSTSYKEIFPNIVIFSEITASQPVPAEMTVRGTRRYAELRQRQRLVNYQFMRGKPGDTVITAVKPAPTPRDSAFAAFGSLSGSVQDPAGHLLAGVTLATEDPALNTKTDNLGQFILRGLLPGDQELTISAPGYETMKIRVDVIAGKTVPLPLVLYPKKDS